jgi:hypothetical protein
LQEDGTWLAFVTVESPAGDTGNRLSIDNTFAVQMYGDRTTDKSHIVCLPLTVPLTLPL